MIFQTETLGDHMAAAVSGLSQYELLTSLGQRFARHT